MADPLHIPGLVAGGWRGLAYAPFHDGIEIARLYGEGGEGPAIAVLRYRPGATVPRHLHVGVEMILVLEGGQVDEHGSYPAGSLLINPPGTDHAVAAPEGCVVLIQWARPVRFLDAG